MRAFDAQLAIPGLVKPGEDVKMESENHCDCNATLEKPVVLIVDDEDNIRDICKRALARNYLPLTASNGQEAIEMVRNNKVDLVVSDYLMEGLNGLETLSAIVKERPGIRGAIMSGHVSYDSNVMNKARQIGVSQFLAKPFTIPELIEFVDGLLQE